MLMSIGSKAADKPDETPRQERYVYLRSAYIEELKGSELPISGTRFAARFLEFKDEFALFSSPKITGMTIYIPKSQILFMVQPTSRY